jgi:geranylgeranyl pyrophosphate synthase
VNPTPGIPLGCDDKTARTGAGDAGVNSAVGARQSNSLAEEEVEAAACAIARGPLVYNALASFANAIGSAFQIQEDFLDVLGDVSTLGKATGADSERAKPPHPAVIGIEASQQRVRFLHAQAIDALAPFGLHAERLAGEQGEAIAKLMPRQPRSGWPFISSHSSTN